MNSAVKALTTHRWRVSSPLEFSDSINSQALLTLLTSEPAQLARAKGFVMDTSGAVKLLQVVRRRGIITKVPMNKKDVSAGGVVCIGLAGSDGETFLRTQTTQI